MRHRRLKGWNDFSRDQQAIIIANIKKLSKHPESWFHLIS